MRRLLLDVGGATGSRLEAADHILDDRGFLKGSVSSSVEQTVGIPETYTYYQREAQIKRLREELMNSFDARMVKEISQNLSLYMMQ